jgi:histone H2A
MPAKKGVKKTATKTTSDKERVSPKTRSSRARLYVSSWKITLIFN